MQGHFDGHRHGRTYPLKLSITKAPSIDGAFSFSYQNPNPFKPLSPLSCFKPPELLPPDFPEPPDLFLLLLAAEDSCV